MYRSIFQAPGPPGVLSAIASLLCATAPEPALMDGGPGPIHRRGRFKRNQRKQRKGRK